MLKYSLALPTNFQAPISAPKIGSGLSRISTCDLLLKTGVSNQIIALKLLHFNWENKGKQKALGILF